VNARKARLLHLDPAVHAAMARWAKAERRSTNAQIEIVLRDALATAERMPGGTAPTRPTARRQPGDNPLS
jgi:hypothetical protein